MDLPEQIARLLRAAVFGGNWTAVNLKTQLQDVTWEEATTQVYGLNTIATLVYHLHYYVRALAPVLQGEPLNASDKLSFDHPPIASQADWEGFLEKVYGESEAFCGLLESMPEEKLWENVADPKYGHFYRNIHGIIEHHHYHLGQIVLLKKIIRHS